MECLPYNENCTRRDEALGRRHPGHNGCGTLGYFDSGTGLASDLLAPRVRSRYFDIGALQYGAQLHVCREVIKIPGSRGSSMLDEARRSTLLRCLMQLRVVRKASRREPWRASNGCGSVLMDFDKIRASSQTQIQGCRNRAGGKRRRCPPSRLVWRAARRRGNPGGTRDRHTGADRHGPFQNHQRRLTTSKISKH
jgi:hypothetical protein